MATMTTSRTSFHSECVHGCASNGTHCYGVPRTPALITRNQNSNRGVPTHQLHCRKKTTVTSTKPSPATDSSHQVEHTASFPFFFCTFSIPVEAKRWSERGSSRNHALDSERTTWVKAGAGARITDTAVAAHGEHD